jgi:hypothetical protein
VGRERVAAGRASAGLATRLDELLPRLRPRIVKGWCSAVLGPSFTGAEGPLGPLLVELEARWPFALRSRARS